jgi:hypothetical protein
MISENLPVKISELSGIMIGTRFCVPTITLETLMKVQGMYEGMPEQQRQKHKRRVTEGMYEADDFIHPFSLPEILFKDIRDKFRDEEGIQCSPQKSIKRVSEKKKEGKRCYSEINREYNATPKESQKSLGNISGKASVSKESQASFQKSLKRISDKSGVNMNGILFS